jgi:Rrf2 family protein
MISQKAKYAFKALFALARAEDDGGRQIQEIALAEKIPRNFLEHILLDLKRHGLVSSRRGKNGGYRLLKQPAAITVGQVLRIVDGPVAPLPCLSRTAYERCGDCVDETTCQVRRAFADVYRAHVDILDKKTLADALAAGEPDLDDTDPGPAPRRAVAG